MGRYSKGFHASLIFFAVFIDFGQYGGKGHPFAWAYILDGNIHLDYASRGLELHMTHIYHHRIGTAFYGQVGRFRAAFRIDHYIALDCYFRVRKRYNIVFIIRVGD